MTDTSPAGASSRQLLREAIGAVKAGDKDAARMLVRQGLAADPFNEQLHLLAASLAHTVKQAVPHVEQVLAINPHNQKAHAWLEQVRKKAAMKAAGNGTETRSAPQAAAIQEIATAPPSPAPQAHAGPAAAQPVRGPEAGRPPTLVERLLAEQRQARSAPVESRSGSRPTAPTPQDAPAAEPSSGGIAAVPDPAPEPPPPEPYDPAEVRWEAAPSGLSDPSGGVGEPAAAVVRVRARVSPADLPASDKAEQPQAARGESWRCPLCEHAAAAPQRRCPQCHAAVHLAAAEMITRQENVDQAALRGAIRRWNAVLGKGPDADAHIALALAHLNLNESAQALTHLRRACELRRGDDELAEAYRTVRARKLIVVAEEDESLRKALVDLLEGRRLRTRAAGNGFQALSLVEEEMPDLILASGSMPRMAGYELCKVVRGNASTKGTPVVLLVDKAGLVDKARGLAAGATGYLTRPIDGVSLLRLLKSLLPDSTLPDPKLASNNMFKL